MTLLSLCCSLFKFNLIDQLSSRGIVIFNRLILGKLSHRNWYIYFIINSLKCLYKCPCFSSLAHYVHNYHKNKWCIKRLCIVMLNCLNIDCDTDLLVVGINGGDWTCLWFDFLNEQEWDKCNLWCSGASVIECRNYSQITFIHISRDYPMNFWWPTFFDCWTSLASMCMYVTRTWTHISQWRP